MASHFFIPRHSDIDDGHADLKIGGKYVGKVESVKERQVEPDYSFDIPVPSEPPLAEFRMVGRTQPANTDAWLVAADRLDELGHEEAATTLRVLSKAVIESATVTAGVGQWPVYRAEIVWVGEAGQAAAEVLRP